MSSDAALWIAVLGWFAGWTLGAVVLLGGFL